MDFDSFQAEILYLREFIGGIRTVRMDRSKPQEPVRVLLNGLRDKAVDGIDLMRSGSDAAENVAGDTRSLAFP